MAPAQSAPFATDLQAQLTAATIARTPETLLTEIENQISNFPNKFGAIAASKSEEVDQVGTTIWNLCTRLRRDVESDNPKDVPIILLLVRVFSFLLLDGAYECGKNPPGNLARLIKIGIKAGKSCIERKEGDLALKVLEKVGGYIKPDPGVTPGDKEACERLTPEYYVLRTALAWHRDQLDMADHMYKLSISTIQGFDYNVAESLADVLYEMGKDLLHKQQYQLAVKWLDRSYEVLNGQELDRLSIDASELRTSIMQTLIKALLYLKNPEALERARSLINLLESVLGDKLIVLLLKLEILSASSSEVFDSSQYSDLLHRMTRSIPMSEVNFKLFMFHVRKLNDKSPSLACKALDELLNLRILREEREEFIEKVLITRIWITVSQRETVEAIEALQELFALIVSNSKRAISSAATHGAHTILWKRIESSYAAGQFQMAEKWCQLATHQIFVNSGEHNLARISRKLLLCAMARKDMGSAREIFSSMSDSAKNEPMSQFLMHKIAVRCGENELAAESLQRISSATTKDPTLLYASCLDAQQSGNKLQTIAALQLVLEKYGYTAPSAIHLPSLLRTTIQLIVSLQTEPQNLAALGDLEQTVEKMCKAFEGAVSSMRKVTGPDSVWEVRELDWFSKNSYNLVIKNLSTWTPRHSLRMLTCCIAFIDHYPKDISDQISEDLCLRKMFCEFSAVTALLALARGEDNIETQLQDYLNLRKHVDSFDALLQEKAGKLGEDAEEDLLRKLSILIVFDFEAACHLKAWDDLHEIIIKSDCCKSSRVYELMADCILCSQAPTQVLVSILKKIINAAWGLDTMDIPKLAKYMRCLFQVAMLDNMEVAEQLLDKAHEQAEEAAETDQPYPNEELEWIATRSFNYAVDLYCAGDEDGCKNWAAKALNIAHYCSDDGALERQLQNKLVVLKLDT
ncbi:SPO22-domain-containing protein [Hyaloscypha variabilis F]|uniref:Protein ZIP4 homolog n=1 Tax=Hyaloscypha variabilis (strain UAMH 11265 / GT02V1 / F) TaxID=1149755 RepID=A0A2J6S2U0_HYAVF|nr:SPO22-domain-containing protein [Hyaloscypha variabilis F]